jgi:valyl-tRNA synthetase
MVKPRAYGQGFSEQQQKAAWYTLHTVLKNVLLLLAPITPFMTDRLWRQLYSKESVHVQRFPKRTWHKTHTNKDTTTNTIAYQKENCGMFARTKL